MTAEHALELFERVARKPLDTLDANTCIEQSRILIEVLRRFGIAAEPLSTKFFLVCKQCEFQFFSSGDPVDHENAKRVAKGYEYRNNHRPDADFGYHIVVLVERRLVVDLTTAQASVPDYGFILRPEMVILPLPKRVGEDMLPDIEVEAHNDDGIPFTARWIGVRDESFRSTPAWEPSHLWPLIDIFEAQMRLCEVNA